MRNQPWNRGEVVRAGLVAASCAAGFLVSLNCTPRGGSTTPPVTTATSNVSFKMSAPGSPKCTADMRWEWDPVSVTGTTGKTTRVTDPATGFTSYDVPSTTDGDATVCFMNGATLTAFATGTWRISLVHAVAGRMADCQVTLKAGTNWAGFRQNVTTCKETPAGSLGFQYP